MTAIPTSAPTSALTSAPTSAPPHRPAVDRHRPEVPGRGALAFPEVGQPSRITVAHAKPARDSVSPAVAVDFVDVGDLTVRAATVRGWAPAFYGETRKDAYAIARTADSSWLVVAVADGVSSARWGHLAADRAARTAVRRVADTFDAGDELDWRAVFTEVAKDVFVLGRRKLDDERHPGAAIAGGADVHAAYRMVADVCSTTLTVAAVPTDATDGAVARLAWAGDSPAWVLGAGTWRRVGPGAADGEIATSAVVALPQLPRGPGVADVAVSAGEALVLTSDGVANPMGEGTNDLATFLADRLATPPDPLEVAALTGFRRRSWDDDRTLLGVWLPAGPEPPEPEPGATTDPIPLPSIPTDGQGERSGVVDLPPGW